MPCSPRMRSCKATCLHYRFVMDYRAERERQLTEAEERSGGYETEMSALRPDLITFKKWLKGSKR